MAAGESQTTMAKRLELAHALLSGADADLRRADDELRRAIDKATQAKRAAATARSASREVFGEIEYQSWITEAAADAEVGSWERAA